MNARAVGFAALLSLSTAGFAEDAVSWPELPQSGFIAGRTATNEDVDRGEAIFSMDGQSLGPVEIDLPQYAIWKDDAGAEHPVIVVQAEEAPNGMQIVGLLTIDGRALAATLPEVRLLGTAKPD